MRNMIKNVFQRDFLINIDKLQRQWNAIDDLFTKPFNYNDDFQIKSLKTESDYIKSSFHLLGHVWGPDRTTFAYLVIKFSPLSKSN